MSLLRQVLDLDRDSVVKANLVERLAECVKELQLKYTVENGAALTNDEATNSLCWTLEAVFIHGLKNRFISNVSAMFSSNRETHIPDPSFWNFVLTFCHKEDIVEIDKLTNIHSDIGRCRAWLRFSLNQCTLHCFLQTMMTHKSTVDHYYKPAAFLRDAERFDIFKNYLIGIEAYDFQLACNSSLLNAWNYVPLSLVGLHTPSHAQESISQGIDVAENMNSKDLQALPTLKQGRTPPKLSHFPPNFEDHYRKPLFEEDESIRIILSNKLNNSSGIIPSPSSSRKNSDVSQPNRYSKSTLLTSGSTNTTSQNQKSSPTLKAKSHGVSQNSIVEAKDVLSNNEHFDSGVGSSSSVSSAHHRESSHNELSFNSPFSDVSLKPPYQTDDCIKNVADKDDVDANSNSAHEVSNSPPAVPLLSSTSTNAIDIPSPDDADEISYAALFETYNKDKGGTPILDSFILDNEDLINSSLAVSSSNFEENRSLTGTPIDQTVGFEVLSNASSSGQFSEMFPEISSIQKIPRNNGLDSQNYRCKNCSRDIGMIYQPERLCCLTGSYYCADCHANEEFVIPSRVLLNWDFSRYSVSKQAKTFLEEIFEQPLFDIQETNPMLYKVVEECAEIKKWRIKLSSISIYLRTCKISKDDLKKELPDKHLYENIHLYSLSDLLSIPSRSLESTLKKFVTHGKNHITSCEFCTQKGFVCEICKEAKVIFPFDLDVIFKCVSCGAVYHKQCMDNCKPCPRCLRWKRTENEQDYSD